MKKKTDFLLGVEYERRLRAVEDHLAAEEEKNLAERLKFVENYHAYLERAFEDLPQLDLKRQSEHVDWLQGHLTQEIKTHYRWLAERMEKIEKTFTALVEAITKSQGDNP